MLAYIAYTNFFKLHLVGFFILDSTNDLSLMSCKKGLIDVCPDGGKQSPEVFSACCVTQYFQTINEVQLFVSCRSFI